MPLPAAKFRIASRLTIKRVVFGSVGLLSVIIIGMLGWQAATDWSDYRRAADQQEFDRGANRFITGLFEVLMERVATNNALQAAEPAGPVALAEIEQRRKTYKENYEPGLAAIRGREFPNKQALNQALTAAVDKANDYRKQADAALKLTRDQRDETLRKTFIPTLTASVEASLNVWFSALHTTAKSDPALARLASIKELGWRMRDQAGQERSTIASAISAGASIPAEAVINATVFRTRVFLLWDQLRNLTLDPATDPAILAAMQIAEQKYFKDFVGLADEMRKLSQNGAKYPMTATQWVDTTTPMIGSLLDVMYAAGKGSEAYTTAQLDHEFRAVMTALALLAMCALIAGLSLWAAVRIVTRPLSDLAIAMRELSDGNLAVVLPGLERTDEIGRVASAVVKFRDNVTEQQRLADVFSRTVRERDEHNKGMDGAVESFRAISETLLASVGENAATMKATAQGLTGVAGDALNQAVSAAVASEETATSVNTVAAAAEQLASSIQEIGRQVEHATRAVRAAGVTTERSVTEIEGLAAAGQRIGDVVGLIQAIAAQTNLLALNATIEAARAGEAGRGFAVVASEVKNLAAQTAKATEEIAQQVSGIQNSTKSAVAAVKEIATAMHSIDEVTTAIAGAVEEQGAATKEISSSVQMAAQGTQTLSGNIASVNGAIGEANRSAEQVLTASTTVSGAAEKLVEEVMKFFTVLRTGPMDRRKDEDPNFKGPEKRAERAARTGTRADRAA
jgi:methyl-accepting chemotaxis protein